jgi:hypothetical protein
LKCTIVVGEGSFKLIILLGFPSRFCMCFLWLVQALEHDLFQCPFMTRSRSYSFFLNLGFFSLFLLGALFNEFCHGFTNEDRF